MINVIPVTVTKRNNASGKASHGLLSETGVADREQMFYWDCFLGAMGGVLRNH